MTTNTLIEEYNEIFPGIEMNVRHKKSENLQEINNDNYYTYIQKNDLNLSTAKKSLEQLLMKANKNYAEAEKLFLSGRLSENELYNYKDRIREITDEINNLNL
jgi:hypothetical protein